MLLTQRISNLLNGVSQQPAAVRPSSQAEIQENAQSHRVLGLRRRPPTVQVAKVSTSTTGYATSFIHEVRQSSTDRYTVVVVGGDLKVFDRATGASQSVVFPNGKSYLTSAKGFKAFTVGDTTYLVNLATAVKRAAKKAPMQANEALVYVRQADFSTTYTVTINGITVTYTTTDAASPTSRASIATDALAAQLVAALGSNAQLNTAFGFSQIGSSIYITRADGADFDISTSDGLADNGLKVIKGSVQLFSDLPAKAVDGMIVQITGDPEAVADNYWMRFTDTHTAGAHGVWVECPAPGTPVALDATTMPWKLVRGGTVLDSVTADAPPPVPSIVPISTTASSNGFTSDPVSGLTFDGTVDIVLSENGDKLDADISAGGAYRSFTARYDVDTTLLNYGENVTVSLYISLGGAAFLLKDSRTYGAGQKITADALNYADNFANLSSARLEITYGGGETPTEISRQVFVTVHRGTSNVGAGAETSYTSAFQVVFAPTAIFPTGTTVALTMNGTTFSFTASGDSTGVAMATGLYGVITGFFKSNDGAGTLTVANGDSSAITWAIDATVTQPSLVLYSQAASLTPSAYVGRVLVNVTDGSQGTVTANGAHSITVSSLTGGISNVFHGGDVCSINGLSTDFVFTTVAWGERDAGDITVCPLPSFVDSTLDEVFFFQNRLGFTSGENVVLSQAGVSANFMRRTATQLLADDVIDVRSAYPNAGRFEQAKEWNDALYLFSSSGEQFALSGDPVLSPQTVVISHKSSFPITGSARPIAQGKFLYFARATSAFTQVMQYFLTVNGHADAIDVTEDVPQYLPGGPLALAGDAALEFLAVLTSGDSSSLWVYAYHYDGDETSPYTIPRKTMSSWSKWTFSGAQILSVSMLDGVLAMLVIRSDGVYLETLDVGHPLPASSDFRDRQGSGVPVAVTLRYRLSRIFMRDTNDTPDTRGRLQLRYLTLEYHDATDFTVTVTPDGRDAHTYTFHSASPAEGEFKFPVLTRNTTVTIEISTAANNGCAFSGLSWEGDYTARGKAI